MAASKASTRYGTVVKLAKEHGVSASTVRRQLVRLEGEHGVEDSHQPGAENGSEESLRR
jgi:DeoR/GlpR family transcriptional regulator of sugar metabolism